MLREKHAVRNRVHNELRKGTIRSEEEKAKMSATKKARYASGDTVAWNKGIPRTEEQKQQMSSLVKQQYADGRVPPMLGKHHPDHLKKMWSELYTGRTLSPETIAKQAQAFHARVENGWVHPNARHIPDDIRALLNDRDWLHHQHFELKRSLTEIAIGCNVEPSVVHCRFKEFNLGTPQRFAASKNEREIAEYITSIGIDVVGNTRKLITPMELDLYLPEYNLAIEHCGIYWHSSQHKACDYHLTKLHKCTNVGIRLLTLFEDEWIFNQTAVKTLIKRALGKLPTIDLTNSEIITDLPVHVVADFIADNCLDTVDCDKVVGMHQNGILHTIVDYTIVDSTIVINKLVQSAVQPYSIDPVIKALHKLHPMCHTFNWSTDSRFNDGSECIQSGFTLVDVTPPDYYWVKGITRRNRISFTPNIDDNTPEKLIKVEGRPTWYKLYNCGRQNWTLSTDSN